MNKVLLDFKMTVIHMSSALARKQSELRLVQSAPLSKEELVFDNAFKGGHSLHSLVPYQSRSKPEFARFFINKYTDAGDTVLDSFSGSGTTAFEACLGQRKAIATDIDPLANLITEAKVKPADIAQVTLALQMLNLRKPVDTAHFETHFEPFYDIRTFLELLNLKSHIHESPNRINSFLHALVLGLLHGHSSGHFSVYSYPQLAPSPKKQQELNIKRHQYPDYRAVVPRLIKRAATVLRDGIPSVLERMQSESVIREADARDLGFISSSSIDFQYVAPPMPESDYNSSGLWLRNWFSNFENQSAKYNSLALPSWLVFMNESLMESARVAKSGSRIVLELSEENSDALVSESLMQMVDDDLASFWNSETIYTYSEKHEALKHAMKARVKSRRQGCVKFLVLRRK